MEISTCFSLWFRTTHGNGQVVAASELGDLADAPERGTHDDGLVAVLLVVVVDAANRLDAGVLRGGVLLLGRGLVPVEDTADEGRDEVGAGLSGGNGLGEGEHEGQVAVDAVLGLQDLGSLDALPCRGDLDEDALLVNAGLLVELRGLASAGAAAGDSQGTYVDDAQGLVHRLLGGEGEACVHLGRDLSGDDLEDLAAELDEEVIEGDVDLVVKVLAVLLAVLDGGVDELGVLGLLGGGEDERGVGGGILGLVLVDGREVSGVADDHGAGGLQLVEGGAHGVVVRGIGWGMIAEAAGRR